MLNNFLKPDNVAGCARKNETADQSKAMTSRFVKAFVVLLLGCVLAWQGFFMVSAGNAPVMAHAGCQCCQAGCEKCAMPVCCTKPAQPTGPLAPVPISSNAQNEWVALATATVGLPLPPTPLVKFYPRSATSVMVATLPLFQWNCSYLI